MVTGDVELAQVRGVPAHLVERIGFLRRVVEGAVEVEGVSGVLQVPGGLLVQGQPGTGVAEVSVSAAAGGGVG